MQTLIVLLLALTLPTFAYEYRQDADSVTYVIDDMEYETAEALIKSELAGNGFVIVYAIDMAKAMQPVAQSQNLPNPVAAGKTLGFCKPSVTLKLLRRDLANVRYCPFRLALYQAPDDPHVYVTYPKQQWPGDTFSAMLDPILRAVFE